MKFDERVLNKREKELKKELDYITEAAIKDYDFIVPPLYIASIDFKINAIINEQFLNYKDVSVHNLIPTICNWAELNKDRIKGLAMIFSMVKIENFEKKIEEFIEEYIDQPIKQSMINKNSEAVAEKFVNNMKEENVLISIIYSEYGELYFSITGNDKKIKWYDISKKDLLPPQIFEGFKPWRKPILGD